MVEYDQIENIRYRSRRIAVFVVTLIVAVFISIIVLLLSAHSPESSWEDIYKDNPEYRVMSYPEIHTRELIRIRKELERLGKEEVKQLER